METPYVGMKIENNGKELTVLEVISTTVPSHKGISGKISYGEPVITVLTEDGVKII
jgi:hypothetical protein